jgi:ribosomal protein S26
VVAKREKRGEKPSPKGSKAYKTAVKAGKEMGKKKMIKLTDI